jgi:LacI family transcriptional regulator
VDVKKPNTGEKRVSLSDVARQAKVSRATASLVLRESPLVAESTRRRVIESQEKLRYVYNRAAASLRTRRTYTIGLVINDISNPFYGEFAVGVEQGLSGTEYSFFLSNTSDDLGQQERVVRRLREYGVDGLLVTPAIGTKRSSRSLFSDAWPPVVLTIRYIRGAQVDYVGVNNAIGAEMAVNHLIEHGHRRIAYLGGSDTSSSRRDRFKGYSRALRKHGIPIDESLSVPSAPSRQGGHAGIRRLLSLSNPPTAVFCYNDVVAGGAILDLWAAGFTPGRDVAIVGFDDIADAAMWRPSLTTISVPPTRIGRLAAHCLMERIQHPGQKAQRTEIIPELVVRASCGCGAV